MLNKAIIDLSKLKSNALKVKGLLKNTTKLCAVVKADGYGHGAVKVASALYPICDYFAVALVEEGVELRQSGIDKPVLVLGKAFRSDISLAIAYNITLSVCAYQDIILIFSVAKRLNKKAFVHIKVNTGMNRLGIDDLNEFVRLLQFIKGQDTIILTGVFSHYAKPQDERERKIATEKFIQFKKIASSYFSSLIYHISASGGTLFLEEFDMVRVGIMLYGYKPFYSDKIELSKVMKLYAPVVESRRLSFGESAFYGLEKTTKDTEIDIIRYGYADGLFRENVLGQFSSRCMDMTAVERKKNSKKFYPVLLSADLLADKYGTISYEILVKSTIRAEKIYIL